jgi:MerC mercury resistance protein
VVSTVTLKLIATKLHFLYLCTLMSQVKLNWDIMGMATSIACAIHCALLPLVLPSLTLLGVDLIHHPVFEWGMIALAFFVGIYALVHGYIRHHRNLLPILIFMAGFVCLVLKQFMPGNENWFLFPAVVLIITAHYRNYKLCHKSKCNSAHHQH